MRGAGEVKGRSRDQQLKVGGGLLSHPLESHDLGAEDGGWKLGLGPTDAELASFREVSGVCCHQLACCLHLPVSRKVYVVFYMPTSTQ